MTNDSTENKNVWNGVTIEELKFMRAAALIRLEMQKELLKKKTGETLPFGVSSSRGVIGHINRNLTFVQKAVLFVKGVRLATGIVSFFKSSKKR